MDQSHCERCVERISREVHEAVKDLNAVIVVQQEESHYEERRQSADPYSGLEMVWNEKIVDRPEITKPDVERRAAAHVNLRSAVEELRELANQPGGRECVDRAYRSCGHAEFSKLCGEALGYSWLRIEWETFGLTWACTFSFASMGFIAAVMYVIYLAQTRPVLGACLACGVFILAVVLLLTRK